MNEEQKEFINELLKDSNQEHGLRLGNKPDKTIMINGENKTLPKSKCDGIHRVFSMHTQVHKNANLKNLGCCGAELQFLK